jgi:hypothetical protein
VGWSCWIPFCLSDSLFVSPCIVFCLALGTEILLLLNCSVSLKIEMRDAMIEICPRLKGRFCSIYRGGWDKEEHLCIVVYEFHYSPSIHLLFLCQRKSLFLAASESFIRYHCGYPLVLDKGFLGSGGIDWCFLSGRNNTLEQHRHHLRVVQALVFTMASTATQRAVQEVKINSPFYPISPSSKSSYQKQAKLPAI